MRTSSYFSFSSFLTLTLSLARAVSNSPTYYEQKLSVVGPGFFDQVQLGNAGRSYPWKGQLFEFGGIDS